MPLDKIKSKDLSYESTLPPFLQRLHDQKAGRGDEDRHERPIARPKRDTAHDDEDDPTVVDESGETVTMAELKKMEAKDDEAEADDHVTGSIKDDSEALMSGGIQSEKGARADSKLTAGTATKKRKAAKVVAEDSEGESKEDAAKPNDQDDSAPKKVVKKAKKKSKPVKLAFNDEDEP